MTDLNALMKQAQGMQAKLAEAQAKLQETVAEGQAGGGLVSVTLKGSGELAAVRIDSSLLAPDEAEVVGDLLIAAHADAKAKLDAAGQKAMQDAMGPLAGMAGGLPGFPGFGR